jgi:KDO2-lipid IV(A) lauroyltransferase
MRYIMETALIRVLAVFFGSLPRKVNLALGGTLGWLLYLLAFRRRRLAMENLEMAFLGEKGPRELRKIARRSFQFLAMNITEFFRFPSLTWDSVSRYVTFEGEEYIREALKQGKGILLLSGHFGNWDFISAVMVLKGYDFAHVSKVPRSKAVAAIWLKYRTDVGIKVFSGRGTIRQSLRHLRNNGLLGMVTDQNARRAEGVFVPFFGRQACTLPSLALLASRTGAPVLPVYSYRTGEGHHTVIGKPISHETLANSDLDLQERTKTYTQWTEKIVRLHPDQWIWLHNRWKTRPKEESKAQGPESKG